MALAALVSLCLANPVDARSFAFSPANTKFILNGAIKFDVSSCKAEWTVRSGGPGSADGKVAIANQFQSKRCQELTPNGLPWKMVAAGPHTYLILKMDLGNGCGPGDVRVNLVDGVSHMDSPVGPCFVRGSFDSTPKLTIVSR
jgi:hypothetical protein